MHIIVLHSRIVGIFILDIAHATLHPEICSTTLSLCFIGPVVSYSSSALEWEMGLENDYLSLQKNITYSKS